jgi:hypothetical protein
MASSLKRPLGVFAGVSLVTVVTLVVLEGLASTTITGAKLVSRLAGTKVHTQYDPELGWSSIPDLFIEDMYGDGVFLRTNAQGFRAAADTDAEVAEGGVRLLCSGDSFTFGHGVDNDHTWCSLLAGRYPTLETVNLGQVGFGIDQAFLWYLRNATWLQHDLHIFAFITDDFRRTAARSFLSYPKPLLTLQDEQLVVTNTPVPKRLFNNPYLFTTVHTLRELRLAQLAERLLGGVDRQVSTDGPSGGGDVSTRDVVVAVFEELQRMGNLREIRTIFVYLPSGDWDYDPQGSVTESWRLFLEGEARERGWLYLDLIADFRSFERNAIAELFSGHYTQAGNEYVAERLHEFLMGTPEISALLDADR